MTGVESSFSSHIALKRANFWSSPDSKPIYVGAIDIGTNSTHLLVACINPVIHTFSIELAEKSTTRLGERDPDSGALTEVAMGRVLETLQRFKELAASYKVEELVIAATSAVREAPNGRDFLSHIKEALHLDVDLVSGPEEARLIYLGVLSGMPFGDRPHLLLDIGGGSTELILADRMDARALTSTRVGAVRLQRDFVKDEPISSKRREFLQTFIEGSLEPAVDKVCRRIKSGELPAMIATSGTAMAIGALVASESLNPSMKLHGYRLSKTQVDNLVDKLVLMTPQERRKLTPINDRRAEIIVPGALILQTTMQMVGVDELILSERALREGLIVDWMLRHGLLEDRFSFQSSIRQRTVVHQAERFGVNRSRSEHVANYALSLYDNTQGILHHDEGDGRDLLWAAAMLHACGQHINLSSYHKHSWYLIRHGELLGYSQSEHLMVAAIARYHRRGLPKKRHEAWQSLEHKTHRKLVFEMSLILRLATSIDRRPEPAVASISVLSGNSEVLCKLVPENPNQNLSLEKWSLENCSKIIKDSCNVKLKVLV